METLEKLLEEIKKLQLADDILRQIWIDVGPYRQQSITDETLSKLNKYMEFDDSE